MQPARGPLGTKGFAVGSAGERRNIERHKIQPMKLLSKSYARDGPGYVKMVAEEGKE